MHEVEAVLIDFLEQDDPQNEGCTLTHLAKNVEHGDIPRSSSSVKRFYNLIDWHCPQLVLFRYKGEPAAKRAEPSAKGQLRE